MEGLCISVGVYRAFIRLCRGSIRFRDIPVPYFWKIKRKRTWTWKWKRVYVGQGFS